MHTFLMTQWIDCASLTNILTHSHTDWWPYEPVTLYFRLRERLNKFMPSHTQWSEWSSSNTGSLHLSNGWFILSWYTNHDTLLTQVKEVKRHHFHIEQTFRFHGLQVDFVHNFPLHQRELASRWVPPQRSLLTWCLSFTLSLHLSLSLSPRVSCVQCRQLVVTFARGQQLCVKISTVTIIRTSVQMLTSVHRSCDLLSVQLDVKLSSWQVNCDTHCPLCFVFCLLVYPLLLGVTWHECYIYRSKWIGTTVAAKLWLIWWISWSMERPHTSMYYSISSWPAYNTVHMQWKSMQQQ